MRIITKLSVAIITSLMCATSGWAADLAGEPGRSQDPNLLSDLTLRLAVAFNTTLLALIMAAILVLLMHIVQSMEERIITRCGHYCLDNLVNRLYKTEP